MTAMNVVTARNAGTTVDASPARSGENEHGSGEDEHDDRR